jgi:hypothetical protein
MDKDLIGILESPSFYKNKPPEKFPNYYGTCLSAIRTSGLWLEFGVWTGTSARMIASWVKYNLQDDETVLYGFDSFEGLPEDWSDPETGAVEEQGRKGYFSLDGETPQLINPDLNIQFIKGWFEDTIPKFAEEHPGHIALLHIDSDLYSSAKTIFDLLGDRIVEGTVIMFDEIYNYPGYQAHELKAFKEFVEKTKISYKWLGHVEDSRQAAIVVTGR